MFSEELIGYFLLVDGMPCVCTIWWIHRGFHVQYSSFFQSSILTSIFSPMSDWVSDALFYLESNHSNISHLIFHAQLGSVAWPLPNKCIHILVLLVSYYQFNSGVYFFGGGVLLSVHHIFWEFLSVSYWFFLIPFPLALYCMGIPLCLLRRVDFIHSHLIFLDHNLIAPWRLCQTYVIIIVLFVYIYIIKVFLMDIIIMPTWI